MRRIGITETAIRDAHQSLIATRMTYGDMEGALRHMDEVGYWSIEGWGGATFDACVRFLGEDPWERLRSIKKLIRKTKIQMLLRGQNLLGYRHYADDTVDCFVRRCVANGVDVVRIFDALNDERNVERAVKACKAEGGHAQATICYTTGPAYGTGYFSGLAVRLAEMGADSLCVKDMAGLLTPYAAEELVRAIKAKVGIHLQIHSHCTGGFASMTYLKAVEAGADAVDCAISPLAMGTSQPPTEAMAAALAGGGYETGLSAASLKPVTEHFAALRERYLADGSLSATVMGVDVSALESQVPGGMLSNLISQLRQSDSLGRLPEVLAEVTRVRAEFGYPPLVTPTSQIVGTQSVLNVLTGERYSMVPKESKALLKGEYGRTPMPVDPELQERVLGGEAAVECRPADLIGPELGKVREEAGAYAACEDDVLIYAMFPQTAADFFEAKARDAAAESAAKAGAAAKPPEGAGKAESAEGGGSDCEPGGEEEAAVLATVISVVGEGRGDVRIRPLGVGAAQGCDRWKAAGRMSSMRGAPRR